MNPALLLFVIFHTRVFVSSWFIFLRSIVYTLIPCPVFGEHHTFHLALDRGQNPLLEEGVFKAVALRRLHVFFPNEVALFERQ